MADPAVTYVVDTLAGRVTVSDKRQIVYRITAGKKDSGTSIEIKEHLKGPQVKIDVKGQAPQTARASSCRGSDPTRWQTGMPTCGAVALGRAAPGIRVELKTQCQSAFRALSSECPNS